MKMHFFVTGTDTDVGKTFCSTALLHKAKQQGFQTLGLKPVAAGARRNTSDAQLPEWVNDDAVAMMQESTISLPYAQVNPVLLHAAIAPHIAAAQEQRTLDAARLAGMVRGSLMQKPDIALVEGAGGFLVPLNTRHTLADLAVELGLPVILVVGMRLGCINHALLTVEAIRARGLPLAGWIANTLDPNMPVLEDNIASLQQRIPAPLLGCVPHCTDIAAAASHLQIPRLQNA